MSLLGNIYVQSALYVLAGAGFGYWLSSWRGKRLEADLAEKEKSIEESAKQQAERLRRELQLEASEESHKFRREIEDAFGSRQKQVMEMEKRLIEREALINHQLESLVREERSLLKEKEGFLRQTEALDQHRKELDQLISQRKTELQNLARLTETEARALLLKEVEASAIEDANRVSRRILEEAKTHAEEKSKRIVALAIQRYCGEHCFETTSATVTLPHADLKGRIIGREGRNIRAFEASTGVTVLIDDTPNAVVLSGFDPVRREIAKESMQRLLLDGRIHPTRIEEVVAKVTEEVNETIVRYGQESIQQCGLATAHPEVIKLLGKLHFRHSFSQNVLAHSVEVAHLVGLMAGELGLDVRLGKRCGLFHDLGKAVSHEMEGPHALVGAELLKRFGEIEEVVNAVACHHDEVPANGPLGILVSAADAISASRPGARSETMATYIKRVEDLERIALSFPGVDKCYAAQAGRELRVIVLPDKIHDSDALALARSISRKIEEELQYPGQIRITVIRETRCIEFAK